MLTSLRRAGTERVPRSPQGRRRWLTRPFAWIGRDSREAVAWGRRTFTGPGAWRRAGLGAVALALVGLTVAGICQVRIDTSIGSFLPAGDPAVAAMQEKADHFGDDPVAVLLESGQPHQLLGDTGQLARLVELEGRLAHLPDVAAVYGPGTAVNQIAISSQKLLAQISGRRDALQTAVDQARAQGPQAEATAQAQLTELEQRYGALIVRALPGGLPTATNPRFVESVIYDQDGSARPQWRPIVPTPTSVAVLVRPRAGLDQDGTSALVAAIRNTVGQAGLQTSRVTVSGVPAITAAMTDQARHEFPLLGVLALAAVAVLYLAVPWTARRRSRLRPLAAALAGTALTLAVFGWIGRPISLGVIAFLPILLGIGSDFPLYLSQPSQRRRVLVAALAGAAAFAALAVSPLPFVRELGLALATGLVATVGVALVFRRWFPTLAPAGGGAAGDPVVRAPRPVSWWVRGPALAVAVAIAAGGWAALAGLPIQAQPEELAKGLPALDEAQYVERVLGASGEINVMLSGGDTLSPQALAWSRAAEGVVVARFGDVVHPITTVPDLLAFLGPDPTVEQIQAASQLLPSYLSSAVITPDHSRSLMVLGTQLDDVAAQQAFVAQLRAALPPPPPGLHADVVGLPVAAASGYQAMTESRLGLNALAVALAGLVLLLGLRRRTDAARAVLVVVLSSGWLLALTWLAADALSPLTVAVGALSTATGCEFAIMLADATRRGHRWLVRSVALAAGAAALGYLVLAASDLAILREFGLLLAGSVVLSCLGAVVVVRVLFPPAPIEPVGPAAGAPAEPSAGGPVAPTADPAVPDRREVTV
jgi:uncharacterized protein